MASQIYLLISRVSLVLFCVLISSSANSQEGDLFKAETFHKRVFAHRGGLSYGPENTIKTIIRSIENRNTSIEVDVQMTKDSVLVLFHDKFISRILLTDENLELRNLSWKELKAIPLRDKKYGVQYVTSLEELFDTIVKLLPHKSMNQFILEMDFKPSGDHAKIGLRSLMRTLNKYDSSIKERLYDHFFISTFYPDVLGTTHKKYPKVKKAFAVINNLHGKGSFKSKIAILLAPIFVKKHQVDIIQPNLCLVGKCFVKKWKRRNILINAYTANTSCEKKNIKKFGIAYTSDCPMSNCPREENSSIGKPKKWCKNCK